LGEIEMAESDIIENCSFCRFFRNHQIMGNCRRFPLMQNKHETDWCGEFVRIAGLEPIHTSVPTTITLMPPPQRKRGRPVKVAA